MTGDSGFEPPARYSGWRGLLALGAEVLILVLILGLFPFPLDMALILTLLAGVLIEWLLDHQAIHETLYEAAMVIHKLTVENYDLKDRLKRRGRR